MGYVYDIGNGWDRFPRGYHEDIVRLSYIYIYYTHTHTHTYIHKHTRAYIQAMDGIDFLGDITKAWFG